MDADARSPRLAVCFIAVSKLAAPEMGSKKEGRGKGRMGRGGRWRGGEGGACLICRVTADGLLTNTLLGYVYMRCGYLKLRRFNSVEVIRYIVQTVWI